MKVAGILPPSLLVINNNNQYLPINRHMPGSHPVIVLMLAVPWISRENTTWARHSLFVMCFSDSDACQSVSLLWEKYRRKPSYSEEGQVLISSWLQESLPSQWLYWFILSGHRGRRTSCWQEHVAHITSPWWWSGVKRVQKEPRADAAAPDAPSPASCFNLAPPSTFPSAQ